MQKPQIYGEKPRNKPVNSAPSVPDSVKLRRLLRRLESLVPLKKVDTVMDKLIPVRIRLIQPPKDVKFCLQRGKGELVDPVVSSGKDLEFSLDFKVKENAKSGMPNFLGDFAQGAPAKRFFYICVGQYAGQKDTDWARKVKIHLSSITQEQINGVNADSGKVLFASYDATAADGSPSCASVPLIGSGWKVIKQ